MEFGKVTNLSDIAWNLPPDPLSGLPPNLGSIPFHIGTTGWGERAWVGTVYPKGTKPEDFLARYSEVFDTIELNTTHYQIPEESKVNRWYQHSASDFIFCPKLPRSISHHRNLGIGTGSIRNFCESIQGLREKLGPCFMQLPPYFAPDQIDLLGHFLDEWPNEIVLHIEFRHEDWFKSPIKERLGCLLQANRTGIVMTDVAGRRDVLEIGATSNRILIRFVGNLGHKTDEVRMERWVSTLSDWGHYGIREVYFFMHQPEAAAVAPMYQRLKMHLLGAERLINRREANIAGRENPGLQLSLF